MVSAFGSSARLCIAALFVALGEVAICVAQDMPFPSRDPLNQLRAEYEEACRAWENKYRGQRGTPSEELIERYEKWPGWTFLPRIVKLGTSDPKAPHAFEALKWFVVELSNNVGTDDDQFFLYESQVFPALKAHHLSNPGIVSLFGNCAFYPTPAREAFLRECLAEGDSAEVRGLACYYLAECLENKAKILFQLVAAETKTNDVFFNHMKDRRSSVFMDICRSIDSKATIAEANVHYERVIDEFGDVKWLYESPLARGKPTLAFMVRLHNARLTAPHVGESAPELSGQDLDGADRKLVDYRGKVVVLHFWATWYGPCIVKIPHLKALAKQYGSDQLCIIGLNYDQDRQEAVGFVKNSGMTWPSWCGLELGESIGSLSPSRIWPDVIIIDHKGVLRYRDPKEEELDTAVKSLIEELAEAPSSRR